MLLPLGWMEMGVANSVWKWLAWGGAGVAVASTLAAPILSLDGYPVAELAAAGGLAVFMVAIIARQGSLGRRIDELERSRAAR